MTVYFKRGLDSRIYLIWMGELQKLGGQDGKQSMKSFFKSQFYKPNGEKPVQTEYIMDPIKVVCFNNVRE